MRPDAGRLDAAPPDALSSAASRVASNATTPRESTIVNAIKRCLTKRRNHCWFIKTQSGAYGGRAGMPDFLVCYRGRFVAIEAKRPGGTLSQVQKLELSRLGRAGAVVLVAFDAAAVEAILDELDRRWTGEDA